MPVALELLVGAEVDCVDGHVGRLVALIVDRDPRRVTHLSVAVKGLFAMGRFVPANRVATSGERISLDCFKDEFFAMARNEHTAVVAMPGLRGGEFGKEMVRVVPPGQDAIEADEPAFAVDKVIGHALGLVVSGDDFQPLRIVLEIGHLFRKHLVTVSASDVVRIDLEGVHLSSTKDQVRDAPSFEKRLLTR